MSTPLLEIIPFALADEVPHAPTESLAERRAVACEILAESVSDKTLRPQIKSAAKFWRALDASPRSDLDSGNRWQNAVDQIDVLLARAETSDTALVYVRLLLDHLLTGLQGLALQKNKKAAAFLMSALSDAIARNESHSRREPELYSEWAQNAFGLPGIISRNREKTEDNKHRVEVLRQGQSFPLTILPSGKRGKRWKYTSNANALAERLRCYVEGHRSQYDWLKTKAGLEKKSLPEWLEAAHKLPAFSAESHRQWSSLAWQILKDVSPNRHPSKHPHLADNATKICNRIGDVDSIEDDEIRETLNQAFEVIATGTSSRKRQKRARLS
jgi:hypothetical protein